MNDSEYEDFLDCMDYATDHVHAARGAVNPDGAYKQRSINEIDRAIEWLNKARGVLVKGGR